MIWVKDCESPYMLLLVNWHFPILWLKYIQARIAMEGSVCSAPSSRLPRRMWLDIRMSWTVAPLLESAEQKWYADEFIFVPKYFSSFFFLFRGRFGNLEFSLSVILSARVRCFCRIWHRDLEQTEKGPRFQNYFSSGYKAPKCSMYFSGIFFLMNFCWLLLFLLLQRKEYKYVFWTLLFYKVGPLEKYLSW